MLNEADTRAKLIDPKLQRSGWTEKMVERDKAIARGMIINDGGDRLPTRRPDYILYYPDKDGVPLAVVEAKSEEESHLTGMQQAKEYMERLGVPFAYSTNGHKIEEYDDFHKRQATLEEFPSPSELWRRYVEGKELGKVTEKDPLLYPYYPFPERPLRYYQEVAVRKTIEAILRGRKKVLLTMATGSGKTYVAFQIVWKLYKTGRVRRVLYLVDRIFLRRQAHDMFFPFGNAREELVGAESIPKHRDIYFATYQTLYSEKDGKKIYELFEPDFFDMVIIDECHRSGWKRWHEILRYFSNAIHLGLTATPKRDDNIDTYAYFGEPVYDYPMRLGIEDGYLAPCEIIRVFTNIDKSGVLNITEAKSQGAKIEVARARRDTFEENVVDTPSQRFDVILTNPPFGGSLAKTLQENLPVPTGSTELAALQYCMRKLKKGGRCGIVLPEGVLFRDGAYKRVKMELLKEFNVHTIISLPPGTFAHIAPKGGTGPKANLVFFDKTGPTKEIWYYELIPPNGENYTKANPVKDEHLADCYEKWKNRKVSENSWIVSIEEIRERDYDLTARNPNKKQETVYAEPEELVESILEKEKQILEILEEFRNILSDEE